MLKEQSLHCAFGPIVHGIRQHFHRDGVDAQEVANEYHPFNMLKQTISKNVRNSSLTADIRSSRVFPHIQTEVTKSNGKILFL